MSTSGNGNSSSVDLSGLVSSPLPENSGSESTALLHSQVEAQPTPIELVSSPSNVAESPVARGGSGFGISGSNTGSRRRGRPRKCGLENADGRSYSSVREAAVRQRIENNDAIMPPGHVCAPPAAITPIDTPPAAPSNVSESLPPSSSAKKPRGRPRGSGNKQPTQAPTAPTRARVNKRHGVITARDLKPHAIFVSPGEDLVAKIIAFAQQGPEDIFIASHYGAVSSATLRQPTTSTGSMTYEGRYDIITLSGSLLQSEDGNKRVWTGGLTVTLSGRDNHIVAGGVAGPMIAATPSQVVVVSFVLPKEEDPEPGTVDPVNTTETVSPAVGGDVNESAGVSVGGGGACTSIGGDVNESLGVGGAGMSIPDNFGGDVNESGGGGGGGGAGTSIPIPEDFFIFEKHPGT